LFNVCLVFSFISKEKDLTYFTIYLTEFIGNYIHQLNCNTNHKENLRLIDGTLAITAIYEKYLNKEFTSAKIITKQNFTYGRFEIRAALPKGKFLRPVLSMISATPSEWARNGHIDVMTYLQNNKLEAGLHYNVKPSNTYETFKDGEYSINSNLNDFHTYSIEWDKFEIKWFFDQTQTLAININRTLGSIYSRLGEPFDRPFRLLIDLGVGPFKEDFFPYPVSVLDDIMEWKCSLFIIDYIRIYKRVDRYEISSKSSNDISADKICEAVMPHIRPKKKENESNSNNAILIVIVSIFSFVLLISLMSIIFVISIKKLKRDVNVVTNIDHKYDDKDIRFPEVYNALNTDYNYINNYGELENTSNIDYIYTLEVVTSDENLNPNPIYDGNEKFVSSPL
jgi:hypothetical protein